MNPAIVAPPARRRWLHGAAVAGVALAAGAGLTGLCVTRPARAHDSVGPIRPAALAPSIRLTTHSGDRRKLPQLLAGHPTAIQLMFTGCSAACPLQGALFAQLQADLDALDADAPASRLRLLSLSIDPLSDDPQSLGRWLARFGAGRRWTAAAPSPADLDSLLAFLKGRAAAPDPHNTQLAMFDAHGRFVWRTGDLPPPAAVVRLADEIARA